MTDGRTLRHEKNNTFFERTTYGSYRGTRKLSKLKPKGWTVAKIAEQEDPKLTSCYRHTKITTTYRETVYENDLKTGRKSLPQLKT